MQQLISLWLALDGRRRAIVLLSVLAMFGGVLMLSKIAATPTYSLLYSGLEPSTAGEVVQSLEQRGVSYDIRGNSIYVDNTRRDELRMSLASEGLPALNGQGYELLDSLSGFGTTAQMFDAAYWRAKEGELARTIVAGPQIRSARVHIANVTSQPFRRATNSTGSVTATSVSGSLTSGQAKALKYLVASAVSGLSPDNVTVIDGRNGIVVSGDSELAAGSTGEDRAKELKQNVERLLEARVGVGNVIVEVNVETATEREAITEIQFDPDSRVAISSEIEERTTSSNDTRAGSVTVASNLPDGDADRSNNNSSSQDSETRERTNFEVSETRREILKSPGAITRVSTAVLVDGEFQTDEQTGQEVWTARSAVELKALEDLVAAAIGLNTQRGDTLTLRSMKFETTVDQGSTAMPTLVQRLNLDVMQLLQIAVLSVVTLVLGLFVLRPMLSNPSLPALSGPVLPDRYDPIASSEPAGALPDGAAVSGPAITGEIDNSGLMPPGLSALGNENLVNSSIGGTVAAQSDPVDKLRQIIENRQDETVEILRNWIEDGEEHV